MTNDNVAEVHHVGDVWRLDLPSDIAAQLGWVDGQKVHVEVEPGGLLLVTPKNEVLLLTALAAVTRQLSRRTTEVRDALNEAIKPGV